MTTGAQEAKPFPVLKQLPPELLKPGDNVVIAGWIQQYKRTVPTVLMTIVVKANDGRTLTCDWPSALGAPAYGLPLTPLDLDILKKDIETAGAMVALLTDFDTWMNARRNWFNQQKRTQPSKAS